MSFKNIIGHERPIRILKTALWRKTLAHAYLFYGEEGIGKRLVAKAFAKAANCINRVNLIDACGQCSSCLHIEAETHPDFISVSPDGTVIKIGQIRALQEQMHLKPMAGSYRFVILNEAESMNDEASNALLKSLEEPPDQTTLILITSQPHAMLETVVSRCQKIRFTPLTDQQVIAILQQKRPDAPPQLGRVVALVMGRIGLALELDPQALEKEWLRFSQILSEGPPARMEGLLEVAQEYARDRETTERALQWIGLWLRDLLMIKVQVNPSCIIAEPSSPEFLRVGDKLSIEEVIALAGLVQWIWKALTRNLNRQLALEVLLLQIRKALSRKS
jgi:DNA polymerase-3 subunit delta'